MLLSGGLGFRDRALAMQQGYGCYALSFDYGQRHRRGTRGGPADCPGCGCCGASDRRIGFDQSAGAALTDAASSYPSDPTDGIPVTYVPARNTVFLALALGWAEVLGAVDLLSVSMRWIIPAIRTAGRSTSKPLSGSPISRPGRAWRARNFTCTPR